MESNWKEKIRPWSYVVTLIFVFFLIVCDGNVGDFNVKENWYGLLETITTTMIVFYFTSRGIEKTTKIFKNKD